MAEKNSTLQEIADHYENRRAQTQAFLCTMATKALVITELQLVSPQKCKEDLQKESKVKADMQRLDELRVFTNQLRSMGGLAVTKRDRLRRTRTVHLRLTSDKRGECFCWRSKRGWNTKLFALATLRIVEVVENEDKGLQSSQKYIRLQNEKRKLELQFEELKSHRLCLSFLSSRLLA